MNIYLYGDIADIREGSKIIAAKKGVTLSETGMPIHVSRRPGGIEVVCENGRGSISFEQPIHFFRALGLMLENLSKGNTFSVYEEPQFDVNGAMIDVSRNSVMTVDTICDILLYMALMGLNSLMLYMEDIYEVDGLPYFGYMRGRYSYDELKHCDEFAALFGIELIPCIQTLAHMEQYLKWPVAKKLSDTPKVLLAGSNEIYDFIEKIIAAAAAPFKTKRIHIGMDEAAGPGAWQVSEAERVQ